MAVPGWDWMGHQNYLISVTKKHVSFLHLVFPIPPLTCPWCPSYHRNQTAQVTLVKILSYPGDVISNLVFSCNWTCYKLLKMFLRSPNCAERWSQVLILSKCSSKSNDFYSVFISEISQVKNKI